MSDRHGRTQSLLLLGKLLDCRDNASPFTLLLDTLEQSAKPLLKEYIRRATSHKVNVVFAASETLRPLQGVETANHIVNAGSLEQTRRKLSAMLPSPSGKIQTLLIFDNLNIVASDPSIKLPAYLSSFLNPLTSLVAVYHLDQPLSRSARPSEYAPPPLTLLRYLATTVIHLHSFSHILEEKAAREKSVAAPARGLREREEGVVQGLGSQDGRGLVLELEYRRKSGRSVHQLFFLASSSNNSAQNGALGKQLSPQLTLLHDHPLFRSEVTPDVTAAEHDGIGEVSFNLSLTSKQRRDRDGVVLPYFDAQNEAGALGEGGRILYDMGVEDDFDEEEDEI